jgi:hypothetical protein
MVNDWYYSTRYAEEDLTTVSSLCGSVCWRVGVGAFYGFTADSLDPIGYQHFRRHKYVDG